MNWKTIENDREKYAAYLCSREWSILKELVKERSKGRCERCDVLDGDAVHHLTYERKYNEHLEDLQHICHTCHEFTHGKSNFDPVEKKYLLEYLLYQKKRDLRPVPSELLFGDPSPLNDFSKYICALIDHIRNFTLIASSLLEHYDSGMDCVEYNTCNFLYDWLGFHWPTNNVFCRLSECCTKDDYVKACSILSLESSLRDNQRKCFDDKTTD